MKQLNVWLENDHVGTLTHSDGKLGFCYTKQWLSSDSATALSHSLPLKPDMFSGSTVNAYFGGLLPEGRLRDLLARQERVSAANDFSLLQIVGGECAGALSLLPAGQAPLPARSSIDFLSDSELSDLLLELPTRPMLAGEDGIRLSLAGAQDKLPVVFQDGRIGLPRYGAASTHILKMPITGLGGTVENEAFCLALADIVGISVAKAHIFETKETNVLLVERYDRRVITTQVERIHQEDFCQALGIPSHSKYQREGGPTISDCFQLLREATKPFAPQVLKLLDYIIFNTLVGNHDAHGKNYSLMYGLPTSVAPLYDVVCTAIYPTLTPKMAMKVGSQYEFDNILPRHWEQLAADSNLNSKLVVKRLKHWANALPAASQELMNQRYTTSDTTAKINREIERRCQKTLRLLKTA